MSFRHASRKNRRVESHTVVLHREDDGVVLVGQPDHDVLCARVLGGICEQLASSAQKQPLVVRRAALTQVAGHLKAAAPGRALGDRA